VWGKHPGGASHWAGSQEHPSVSRYFWIGLPGMGQFVVIVSWPIQPVIPSRGGDRHWRMSPMFVCFFLIVR
jgi:hypothetical protein